MRTLIISVWILTEMGHEWPACKDEQDGSNDDEDTQNVQDAPTADSFG